VGVTVLHSSFHIRTPAVAMDSNLLSVYRKKATFDVGALRNLLEGEDIVEYKYRIWDTLERDPLFVQPSEELTLEQQRELAFKRAKRIQEYNFLTDDDFMDCPLKAMVHNLALLAFDSSVFGVLALNAQVKLVYVCCPGAAYNVDSFTAVV